MKQKHFIDSHKCATFAAVLFLISYFEAWDNLTLWIYLGLHGTYGILWMLKSLIFGDKQWEQRTSLLYGLLIWGALSLYWITPYLIIKQSSQPPGWYLCLCIMLFVLGVFLHFTADMQKTVTLELKKGLIRTGMFKYCRNPNYVGELFIYLGFSLLAIHWIPLAVLALFIIVVWIPNMIRKDKSLSRYEEFTNYKKRTFAFIPLIY